MGIAFAVDDVEEEGRVQFDSKPRLTFLSKQLKRIVFFVD